MTPKLALATVSAALSLATVGCAVEGDDALLVQEESSKADDFSFPSDFPSPDQHCEWSFNGHCDYAVEFGAGQWGALGIKSGAMASGEGFTVRTFADADAPSSVRARLYYAPAAVTSLAQAQQVAGVSLTRTPSGFGGAGVELRLSGVAGTSMASATGVFYVALSGTDGVIRAIDLD